MNIVFRCDASPVIGTGHLYRCITLATKFKHFRARCIFISRGHDGAQLKIVEESGFELFVLREPKVSASVVSDESGYFSWLGADSEPDDFEQFRSALEIMSIEPDWIVCDHYAISSEWENLARQICRNVFVIDDLANRKHCCSILLDQNFHLEPLDRYSNLILPDTFLLTGPKYALLRPQFKDLREKKLAATSNSSLKKVLCFFGGIASTNLTNLVINLALRFPDLVFDYVLTAVNGSQIVLETVRHDLKNLNLHLRPGNFEELMARADLALGAGGSTQLERMCLGVPTIIVAVAKNQVAVSENLASKGYIFYVGEQDTFQTELVIELIDKLLRSQVQLNAMRRLGLELVDGNGTDRVFNLLKLRTGN